MFPFGAEKFPDWLLRGRERAAQNLHFLIGQQVVKAGLHWP